MAKGKFNGQLMFPETNMLQVYTPAHLETHNTAAHTVTPLITMTTSLQVASANVCIQHLHQPYTSSFPPPLPGGGAGGGWGSMSLSVIIIIDLHVGGLQGFLYKHTGTLPVIIPYIDK